MGEELKVFKNVSGETSASVDIVSNDSTTRAVLKGVVVNNVSLTQNASGWSSLDSVELNHDGITVAESDDEFYLTGTHIVDTDSDVSVDLVVSTVSQSGSGMVFNATSVEMNEHGGYELEQPATAAEVIATSSYSNKTSDSLSASCAFTMARFGELIYCRLDPSDYKVYAYDEDATFVFSTAAFSSDTAAVCNGGNYIYGKGSTSNAILQRKSASSGISVDQITLSSSFEGATGIGGYLLYYDGYLYSKSTVTSTEIQKIDVESGVVTTISCDAVSKSVGAIITVSNAGVPFIVEIGDLYGQAVNLVTESASNVSGGFSGITNVYGNCAFELAPGVCAFTHSLDYCTIDVNESPHTVSAAAASGTAFSGSANNAATVSIASTQAHNTDYGLEYDVYASGVEITGA